jgi:hypothetical protein
VVIERNVGEVGIGKLEVGDVGTVNLEFELVVVVEDRKSSRLTGGEVFDRMVEVELLHLGTGRHGLLDLGDEHVEGLRSEHLTLLGIEVRVVGVDVPLVVRGGTTPRDTKLYIVVLKSNERKGGLPVLTESETERVEPLGSRTTVEVTGDGLGRVGRGEDRRDEGRVGRILLIDNLTTHEKFHLGNYSGPIGDSLGRATVVGNEVDVVEHVTLALEADGRHTVVRDVALNDLTLDSLGEVRMTLVGGPEERHLGLTDEVHILGSDGYELGNTTRHFII